jgi:hypothetical protein
LSAINPANISSIH